MHTFGAVQLKMGSQELHTLCFVIPYIVTRMTTHLVFMCIGEEQRHGYQLLLAQYHSKLELKPVSNKVNF